MPRSKVRGGRKAHNKRIKKRKVELEKKFKEAHDELWRRYYESKKEGETMNNEEIKLDIK
jgi:hypothetical protein